MKTLYLVRHAKAVSRSEELPDFSRSLVKKGEKDASSVAKMLKREGVMPDIIISSPANRAIETAHIFAKRLGYPVKAILLRDMVYENGGNPDFIKMIQELPGKYKTAMIVGHDPSMSELAGALLDNDNISLPKTGVFGVTFKGRSWKVVDSGTATFSMAAQPVDKNTKARMDKQLRKEITKLLSTEINEILCVVDEKSAKKMAKQIDATVKDLVQNFVNLRKSYAFKNVDDIHGLFMPEPSAEEPETEPVAECDKKEDELEQQNELKKEAKPKQAKKGVSQQVKARKEAKPTPEKKSAVQPLESDTQQIKEKNEPKKTEENKK